METTKTPQPVEAVSVPVKAAATTAANAVALAAAAVASGGTTAVVATALGVTAAGAALKGGKKVAAARSQRKAFRTRSATAGGTFRSGKATGTGTGKRGTGTTGTTGTGARKAKTGIAGIGRSFRKSSGSGQNGGTGARPSARRASGSGASTPARSGSGRSGSLAARARRISNSPARRWAGKRITGATTALRSGTARTAAATRSARRKSWSWLRKWFQRNIMGRKPEPKRNVPAPLVPTRTGTDLKAAFERGLINAPITGTATPARITPPLAPSFIAPPTRTPTGGIMKDIARQMVAYAEEYDAPGALEIIDELDNNLEGALQYVSDAYKILSEKARHKWPFDDAIVQKLSMIGECLDTAAQMARGVVPDIETIHEAELRRLRQPGVGQEKFDLSANGLV